jgi:adenylate cyclase class IV
MKKLLETAATTDTLADKLGFLRLMQNFSGTHLIFREPTSITSTTKRERELVYDLDSVDTGITLLEGIGLRPIRRQEKCRESYELNDVRYHLDTWPGMKTYMEVEAFDDVAIYRGVTEIDYDPKTMKGEHAENLFRKFGIDPAELRFSEEELTELGLPRRSS